MVMFVFILGVDDLEDKVDFIICLGGDGTLLYASSLFQVNLQVCVCVCVCACVCVCVYMHCMLVCCMCFLSACENVHVYTVHSCVFMCNVVVCVDIYIYIYICMYAVGTG